MEKQTTEQIINGLLRERGTSYLREGNYFVNAVEDLGGSKEDVRLLRYLVEVDGASALLDAGQQQTAMRQTIYSQTVEKICGQTLVAPEQAHKICAIFWRAVYGEEPPVFFRESAPHPAPKPTPSPQKAKSSHDRRIFGGLAIAAVAAIAILAVVFHFVSGSNLPALDVPGLNESIEPLIQAGTEDTYTFLDGSYMMMYFDESNNERCRIYYDKNGEMERLFVAEYDAQGNVINHWTFDGSGVLLRTDLYTYDQDGNTIREEILLENGKPAQTITREYDDAGTRINYERTAGDGTLLCQRTTTYDDSGTEYGVYVDYNGAGYEKEEYVYKYDEHGNVVSVTGEKNNGASTYTSERSYTYDSQGKMLSCTDNECERDSNGLETVSTTVVQYNENEDIVKQEYLGPDKSASSVILFEYYGKGNPSKKTSYRSDGELLSVEMYNKQGNRSFTEVYGDDGGLASTTTVLYGPHNIEIGTSVKYPSGSTDRTETIRSIVGERYIYVSSIDWGDDEQRLRISSYDLLGHIFESRDYDENETLFSLDEYKLDRYGYIIERTWTYYPNNGNKIVTIYDAQGDEQTETVYYADGTVEFTQYEYEYDEENRLSQRIEKDENGLAKGHTEYTYDSLGRIVKEANFDGDDNIRSWRETTYDAQGNADSQWHYPD